MTNIEQNDNEKVNNPEPGVSEVYCCQMETVIDDDGREGLCDYFFCGNCDEELDIYEWDPVAMKSKLRDTCPKCGFKLSYDKVKDDI